MEFHAFNYEDNSVIKTTITIVSEWPSGKKLTQTISGPCKGRVEYEGEMEEVFS